MASRAHRKRKHARRKLARKIKVYKRKQKQYQAAVDKIVKKARAGQISQTEANKQINKYKGYWKGVDNAWRKAERHAGKQIKRTQRREKYFTQVVSAVATIAGLPSAAGKLVGGGIPGAALEAGLQAGGIQGTSQGKIDPEIMATAGVIGGVSEAISPTPTAEPEIVEEPLPVDPETGEVLTPEGQPFEPIDVAKVYDPVTGEYKMPEGTTGTTEFNPQELAYLGQQAGVPGYEGVQLPQAPEEESFLDLLQEAGISLGAEAAFAFPQREELTEQYQTGKADIAEELALQQKMGGVARTREEEDFTTRMEELKRSNQLQQMYGRERLAQKGIYKTEKSTIGTREKQRTAETYDVAQRAREKLRERRLEDVSFKLEEAGQRAEREQSRLREAYKESYPTWSSILEERVTPSLIAGTAEKLLT